MRFRAWDTFDEVMFNDILFSWQGCGYESLNDCLSDERWKFIQSTGLLDKNGKEIFESDIVKTTRFFGRADESGGFYEYEKEFIGIVKQLEGAWVIDTEKGAVYLWSDIDENEVLGNIWENPKLLEEVKDE